MVRESGKEGQSKTVSIMRNKKAENPTTEGQEKTAQEEGEGAEAQEDPDVVSPDAAESTKVTHRLFLIPNKVLAQTQSAPLTCRSRVTSVNW